MYGRCLSRAGALVPIPKRSAEEGHPTRAKVAGRRRGDAILLAFDYACERDDLEVAAQLLIDYESVVTRLPLTLNEYRREEFDNLISAHGRLWTLLRSSVNERYAVKSKLNNSAHSKR